MDLAEFKCEAEKCLLSVKSKSSHYSEMKVSFNHHTMNSRRLYNLSTVYKYVYFAYSVSHSLVSVPFFTDRAAINAKS